MVSDLSRRFSLLGIGLAFGMLQFMALTTFGAVAGDLDVTFGGTGHRTFEHTFAVGRGVAVQQDGKVVAAGWGAEMHSGLPRHYIAVSRLNPNGTLDESFAGTGTVRTSIGGIADFGSCIALQSDGKFLVAGHSRISTNNDFALVRYKTDGVLDTSFGTGGKATAAVGFGDDNCYGMAVQGDGKIVLTGWTSGGGYRDVALVRFNADGTLDTSFGNSGRVTTAIGISLGGGIGHDEGRGVVLQSDGKIVVAGYSYNGSNNDFALVRYNADGSLDPEFGTGGMVTTAIGDGNDESHSVALQGDGKIVVAGYSYNGSNNDFALVRYNADGSLDPEFGTEGKVITAISTGNDVGHSAVLQKDGKIVVTGVSENGGREDFSVVRYNADGTLDVGFGGKGMVTTAFGSGDATGWTAAVQADGKIVVAGGLYLDAGSSVPGIDTTLTVARYEGVNPLATVNASGVTEITATSAHLVGTVNPHGAVTDVFFETARADAQYESSGNVTANPSPVGGGIAVNISATKTGLLPHTTYKFRVNADGRGVSGDVFFTTANSQPVANDKTIHPGVAGGTYPIFSVATDASDEDGDALMANVASYSGTGLVSVTPEGVVNYTGGFLNGSETVVIEVNDGFEGSDQATITLENTAPRSETDIVGGPYARTLAIPVLANDTDADGDSLSVVSFTQPLRGELTRSEVDKNALVYIPEQGFSGFDTFTYTMSDGRSAPVAGTVAIAIGSRPETVASVFRSRGSTVPGAGVEGNGIPAGATWNIFGEPAINDAGQVAIVGTWRSTLGNGTAIFVDDRLVVKVGDRVPGFPDVFFKSFKDPVINAAGRVAFLATITGRGVNRGNNSVLVTDAFSGALELVARKGDVLPETGGAKLRSFYNISLQGDSLEHSGLLFTASLLARSGSPRVTLSNDLGTWLRTSSPASPLRKMVREGDPGFTEGERIKTFQLLSPVSGSPAQGRSHYAADGVSFVVTLTSQRQALVNFAGGTREMIASTGDLLGADFPYARWRSFGLPASTPGGKVSTVRAVLQAGAGSVTAKNATGIFLRAGHEEGYRPVVRVGDQAFGVPGAVFSSLTDPVVSEENSGVAFVGSIRGSGVRPAKNTGIWWQTEDGWSLVAREGEQATGTPTGARWRGFSSLALLGGARGPIFLATLVPGPGKVNASNGTGVWGVDSNGELRLLVRERDAVSGKILKSFSTLKAVSGSAGVTRSFNSAGQLVYRGYFTDGSQGIVKVQVP